jgi:GNAT superfamily N-acetyltransferase
MIETGIFDMAEQSQYRLRPLLSPNVRHRCLDYSHPLGNIIGAARFTCGNVDQGIATIIRHFCNRRQAFSWRVGPTSTPADIGSRLLQHGLTPGPDLTGMAFDLNCVNGGTADRFIIRKATAADIGLTRRVIELAYPLPAELAATLGDLFTELGNGVSFTLNLVFRSGSDNCIGLGMLYMPDESVAILPGAAVLAEFRNQGVYQQLLRHRMAEASTRGCKFVVTQAVTGTSAPICRHAGFKELCSMKSYVWNPE